MILDLARQEAGDGPPLVILHGLFGQARNWGTISRGLTDHRHVVALDLRNHGESPWANSMHYEDMADDVAAVIADLPDGPADLVGHSMGGKVAMIVALTRPDLVARLMVVDIAPVSYAGGSLLPYVRAMRAINPEGMTSRKEVDLALEDYVADPGIRSFLLTNLVRAGDGFAWGLNLPAIEAGMDTLSGFPDPGGQFDGPTTFLAGSRSDYVTNHAETEIKRLFPSAEIRRVEGAGHWIHAEAPKIFLEELKRFLQIG